MRIIWLILALLGAGALAWVGASSPMGRDGDGFSVARAMVDIGQIAREPHPVGSPQNARVHDYLVKRMTELGLDPQQQSAPGFDPDARDGGAWLVGAQVENVIGVLPGSDRAAPALVLMAHYDSVPGSPGAADDATGVATALEVARLLKLKGQPQRDVIILITDGEEAGLLGANAFFRHAPMARRVGLIINMEARGGGGRANMFETGSENGALIDAFKETASRPISSALAVFLYEKMPNDTDFSVAKAKGLTGLNYAFIGRQFDYHSPTSTVANLDRGSVRSMGDQVFAAASDLAYAKELPPRRPNAVYSQTFGDHVLAYPAWAGWLILAGIAGLLLIAGYRARKADAAPHWLDGLRGAGGGLFLLLFSVAVLRLARRATGVEFGFFEQRPLLAQWGLWEGVLFLLGLGLLVLIPTVLVRAGARWGLVICAAVAGVACSLFGGFDLSGLIVGLVAAVLAVFVFGQPARPGGAWAGVLLLGLLLGVVAQVLAPAIGFLIAWPLALAAMGAALSGFGAQSRWWSVLALLAAVAGGWLGVYVHVTAQGLDLPDLLALFVFLAALVFWPLTQSADLSPSGEPAQGSGAAWLAGVLLAAGIGLFLFVRVSDPWTARNPQATIVNHVTDAAGMGWLTTPFLSSWTEAALKAGGGTVAQRALPPFAEKPVYATPALAPPVPRPTLEQRTDPDGRVSITLTPPPNARLLRLNITTPVAVKDVTVQHLPAQFMLKPGVTNRLRWVSAGEPLVLSFAPTAKGEARITYSVQGESWPAGVPALPKRPADVMAWGGSDSGVVLGEATVGW